MTAITFGSHRMPAKTYVPIITVATLVRIEFWIACLAGLGDALTTWIVLERRGTQLEGNPIMRWPMQHWGVLPTCLGRALLGILIFWHLSRRIMGRPMSSLIERFFRRIWFLISLKWIWQRVLSSIRTGLWLLSFHSLFHWLQRFYTIRDPNRLTRLYRWLGGYLTRAGDWLFPRLIGVEFLVATGLTMMVVGNNIRAVATL